VGGRKLRDVTVSWADSQASRCLFFVTVVPKSKHKGARRTLIRGGGDCAAGGAGEDAVKVEIHVMGLDG